MVSGKEKARKKIGSAIAKHKQVQRIRKSKEERIERSARAAQRESKQVDLLTRSTQEAQEDGAPLGKGAGLNTGQMNMDAFLDGGFEKAMMEAEDTEESDDGSEDEEEDEGMEEDSEDEAAAKGKKASDTKDGKAAKKAGSLKKHKEELEALAKSDPEFYKYLQQTDKTLLDFAGGDEDEDEDDEIDDDDNDDEDSDDDDDDDDEDDEDDDDDDEAAALREAGLGDELTEKKQKKAASKSKSVEQSDDESGDDDDDDDAEVAKKKKEVLKKQEHLPTLKKVITAFRCAVHYGDENAGEEAATGYSFPSAHVFNLLMQFCFAHLDEILRRHCVGGKAALGKAAKTKSGFDKPDVWPHWKRHQGVVKSYLTQLVHFVGKLSEPAMLLVVLQQLHRMLPFFVVLPKMCPKLLRVLLTVWSSEHGQEACLQGRALHTVALYIEHALKGLYLTYARSCRSTNRTTLQRVVLMSSCVVDVCGMDLQIAYQHGFVYIRQLAIHLRNALQKSSEEAYRQVYNWQFINCIRLWAQVLCAYGKDPKSTLRQLLYPLVQVCLGTARLLPNIRFAPLRFQCVRTLTQLSSELGIFVPVAPLVMEVFNFAQLSKTPGKGKDRPYDWSVMIKVAKADTEKRQYQEGMMAQALRKVSKKTKITSLQSRIRKLCQEVEKQSQWVQKRREAADFSPKDHDKIANFLRDEREQRVAPFSQWFAKELKAFEASEAQWRKQAEGKGIRADRDDDDGDDDDDDEMKEEPVEKKKKKKTTAKRAEPTQGKSAPAAADGGQEDMVEELVLSDMDDD